MQYYYADNLPRLRVIKSKYDPGNQFSFGMSIPLAPLYQWLRPPHESGPWSTISSADKVDRQKLICAINVGVAAMAVGLAVLGWLHLLNPT
jgi:hypothetical protein